MLFDQFKAHNSFIYYSLCFAVIVITCVVFFRSGYDFGYLLKILTNNNLPTEENAFFEILELFFPAIYDVKYLMKSCQNLKVSTFSFYEIFLSSSTFSPLFLDAQPLADSKLVC